MFAIPRGGGAAAERPPISRDVGDLRYRIATVANGANRKEKDFLTQKVSCNRSNEEFSRGGFFPGFLRYKYYIEK